VQIQGNAEGLLVLPKFAVGFRDTMEFSEVFCSTSDRTVVRIVVRTMVLSAKF
jgi:hypothetical protein